MVMEEKLETVGERVRWARKQKKWGQVKFAKEMGLSQQAISLWENGDTHEPRHMHRAADVLGVRYKWLADGEMPIWDEQEEAWLKEARQLLEKLSEARRASFIDVLRNWKE